MGHCFRMLTFDLLELFQSTFSLSGPFAFSMILRRDRKHVRLLCTRVQWSQVTFDQGVLSSGRQQEASTSPHPV